MSFAIFTRVAHRWLGECGVACAGGEEGSEQMRGGGDLCAAAPTWGQQSPQTEWPILPMLWVI